MSAFVTGIDLSRQLYREAVRPILDAAFPGLPHSAALLGRGSEVLGCDDEMSRDHNWEPRVVIFLSEDDHARQADALDHALRDQLPSRFGDHPTDYSIVTLRGYFLKQLDIDIDGDIGVRDWLTFAEQQLVMITSGAVFHDGLGLQAARDRFSYYPHDVWLYLLVAAWWRIHPEVNLVGRVGCVGDELGSSLIGAQLVHDLMHLCFLMERTYAPYSKWFGTAFSRLNCADEVAPILRSVVRAQTWPERETALIAAYGKVAAMHNALQITEPVSTAVEQMWNRPFKVLWGDFPGLIGAQIEDPEMKRIVRMWPTGGVDQLREFLWASRSRQLLLAFTE